MNLTSSSSRGLLQTVLRRYCEDPVRFARFIMGVELTRAQRAWTSHFNRTRCFHAAPRDHGKSLVYGQLLVLWELARNPTHRVLVISKTRDLAARFVTTLRTEIETNPRLRFVYGLLKPDPARVWNRYALVVNRPGNLREASVLALGALGPCTGLRAELVICDDLIDSADCQSRLSRDRLQDWFLSELTPTLVAGGRLLVVGTRKHHDDLYARLMANPAYTHRIDKAILNEQSREVLMPERWTFERLLADRAEIGTVLFNREKQNEVVDNHTALFRREWLEAACDPSQTLGQVGSGLLVQGIDLAAVTDSTRAEENDTDYSVVVTLEMVGERMVVRDLWMDRGLSPEALLAGLAEQVNRHRPALVLVENNGFQQWVAEDLRNRVNARLEGHTTHRSNRNSWTEGLPSLVVLFEQGRVVLPTGDARSRQLCGYLVDQLHGLGSGRHDDLALAFWLAVRAARQTQVEKPAVRFTGPLVRKW